ncbi:ABC transporter permease (plasmid) [Azospirillum baldaniorum]|uniref:Sulfonate ABC transporter, permease protein (SsuC/ycbM-like) n=1 Tax=Azospirillum baldaniorum TaxID=1064539 RepID=A0A9P1JY76_9PROT|nr:ABC transporter permease [Azospirillum baldaniorum]AWJ93874.1 ABC transporter permease [Azospirillum baldaniorum]TWA81701.1 sulfonate transport system permease protein [Azospirillum brasilense]CCD02042.1 putative sulfonate ABC transporter, permease protein (ssuC/ycbM-like) [Azospirillum baldaniorum]
MAVIEPALDRQESGAVSLPEASGPAPRRRWLDWLAGLIVPLALALGWEVAVAQGWANGRLLPPPSRILSTLWGLWRSGDLITHVLATLGRVGLGFLFGVLAGTVLGALTGYLSWARRLLDPTLQALRSIPSIAWVPLFILWFGIFETSKVILIAVGVFFPIYLALSGAILDVDRKLVEVGRIFRLSGPALVWCILLPATLPAYALALRAGLGLGWMFVVAAEFMGASEGLGFLLTDGQMTGQPATILASIVAFAVFGKLTDGLLAALSRPLLRWQDSFKPEG